MRRISGPLTLAGFIGLALACQESDAPTTSTRDAAQPVTQGDGKVTAADGSFPSPGNIPSQPSPGGLPSQPSPGGGGVPSQPSPGNIPSQPSPGGGLPSQPSPVNPSSFPSPTGGSGGATPTPTGGTPTATPTGGTGTPTGTVTPGLCPATATFTSIDVPFNTSGGGTGPDLRITGLSSNCRIVNVRTAFRVTATNLANSTSTGQAEIGLFILGTVNDFALIDLSSTTDLPLQGTTMGTTCPNSNLRFVEGAQAFANATPPYVGNFRPFGLSTTPGGSGNFNRFDGLLANNTTWTLPFFRLDGPVTVECWTLELDLTTAAPQNSPFKETDE